MVEYTANSFGGALKGAILVASFNGNIALINLNDAGTGLDPLIDPGTDGILGTADDTVAAASGITQLITGLSTPLDVIQGPNGTIWVAEIGGDFIKAFAPSDIVVTTVDFDGDGILNTTDPFIRDASNGKGVTLFPGQTLKWDFDPNQDNNLPGPNGYGGGLTGVMINGSTDFEKFFQLPSTLPGNIVNIDNVKFITAAGGGTTVIENVSNGDATGTTNTGEYLFHTGFKLAPTIDLFKIKWSVINPLLTGPNQQIGGYIGTGDQSNYLKIVATGNPAGEIQIVLENNNVVQSEVFVQANNLFSVPVDQQIFFELLINPSAATATPTITYEIGGGITQTVAGAPINLSGTNVLKSILGTNTVQGQTTGLAVGLYSSNVGQTPAPNGSFQAIFTDIEVTGVGNSSAAVLYRVNAGGPTIAAIDGGPNWVADGAFLLDPGSNSVAGFSAVEPGSTVPSSTPGTIFDTERYDLAGGTELQYGFAVNPGTYEVRLYVGNGFVGTASPGQRVFDVKLEGTLPNSLNDIDLSNTFGNLTGGTLSNIVQVSDGTLNIDFIHQVENPLINGIEIIQLSSVPSVPAISIVNTPSYTVSEGNGKVQISLLSSTTIPANETVTVNFQIVPGTSTPGQDYTFPSGFFLPETGVYTGSVIIAGSSSDATFLIDILQDALPESSEAFTVNITSVSPNAQIGATPSATVTILDDDNNTGNVVVAINAGGPALTQGGINFAADNFFLNGVTYEDGAIAGDTPQPIFDGTIYETERFGGAPAGGPLSYSIPVAPGNYTVELYFAEVYQTTPGARVFDVSVEGQLVLDNLDILAQNGGNINQPFIFNSGIISPNTFGAPGAIDITFRASADNAKVSGIVVRSASSASNQVSIAATTQASEPASNGLFTVSLSQAATTNTVVTYSVAGTATAGTDYTALTGTVTIAAGSLSATIPVSVLDDLVSEGSESVIVTLTGVTGPTGVVLGATTAATVNIADNDSPVSPLTVQAESITNLTGYRLEANSFATGGSMLSLIGGAANETGTATFAFTGATGNYNVILGAFDENDGVATLNVAKNGTSIGSVLLNQNLASNAAVAATKVEKSVTTGVAIATGDTIKVTGVENAGEPARFDFIRFESAGPAVPAVSIAATTNAAEPSSNGLFTVNLSQVATTNTVVAYSIGGTATAGADYTALSGTVTVLANQLSATIPVSVLDDLVSEGSESVVVTLTGASGSNAVLGATKTATVSIADNESLPPSTLTFQAETANTIVNYRNESIGVASGGQVLSLVGGASNESGSASFVFGDTPDEVTGTYNMVLGTFDENDGVASFTVQLTDFETQTTTQIGSLLLNANLGSAVANAQTAVSPMVATGISLTPGDIIKVNGFENGLEHARFDFLKLMPV